MSHFKARSDFKPLTNRKIPEVSHKNPRFFFALFFMEVTSVFLVGGLCSCYLACMILIKSSFCYYSHLACETLALWRRIRRHLTMLTHALKGSRRFVTNRSASAQDYPNISVAMSLMISTEPRSALHPRATSCSERIDIFECPLLV